ncbi:hypothetical protein JCM10213v2_007364 [Rhodosporidiobolus nylandii]
MDDTDEFDDAGLWDALDESVLSQLDSLPQVPRASQLPPKPAPPPPPPAPLAQQQRRFPLPGPSQVPLLGTARPGVLRPAQPPPRKKARVESPAPAPAPAPPAQQQQPQAKVHPRSSLNAQGQPGFVDPNPWAARSGAAGGGKAGAGAAGQVKPEREVQREDSLTEEDLPAIQIDEKGGGYRAEPQRGTTVSASRGSVPPAALPAGRAAAPPPAAGAQGVQAGLNDQERRELEELRRVKREKEELQAQLLASQAAQQQLQQEVMTKTGENKIVRGKLSKAEAAHQARLKDEQRDKLALQQELEQKEKEYKAAMERMKMEDAFRRQELATSSVSRHRSSSHRPSGSGIPGLSSANSQRFYARASTAAPVSPSTGRSRTKPPPPQQPVFGAGGSGFNASPAPHPLPRGGDGFGPSQTQGRSRNYEREGSMGPPRLGAGAKGKGKDRDGLKKDVKGKGRATQLQLEEDESFFGPSHGGVGARGGSAAGDESEYGGGMDSTVYGDDSTDVSLAKEDEREEEDEQFPWDWVVDARDEQAELLAAVFAHQTLAPIDAEPAGPPPLPPHHHPHHRLSSSSSFSTAHPSYAASTRASVPPSFLQPSALRHSHSFIASTGLSRSHSASSAPTPSSTPFAAGPTPTLHALLNLRLPPTTPPLLAQHYELTSRSLFTLLGRRAADPHHHVHPPSPFSHHPAGEEPLSLALARHLATLLALLEAARLPGPMTALLRLLSTLVFLFPDLARACSVASGEVPSLLPLSTSAGGAEPHPQKQKMEKVALLPLLGRIIARYGRPEPPAPPAPSSLSSRLGPASSLQPSRTFLRSRKARLARPTPASSSSAADGNGEEEVERMPLEKGRRERLLDAVVGVLEGVAWRLAADGEKDAASGVREAEDAEATAGGNRFIALVRAPAVVATLLDPNQPIGLLLSVVRLLTLLACRPALFRPLLGVKLYDAPDTRASKLPLVDRIATLLVMPRPESSETHRLSLSLLSLSLRLLTKHEDAIMLVAQSAAFVPELLAKMYREVRTVWEWDGWELGGKAAQGLKRTVHRLSLLVHLFYYLAHAPHSSLTINDLLSGGPVPAAQQFRYQLQAVNDLFTSAFGTLAFATLTGGGEGEEDALPSWTREEGFEDERARLVELGYLSQELLEDVAPDELEEIEACFGPPDAEDGEEEDELGREEEGMELDAPAEDRVAEGQT